MCIGSNRSNDIQREIFLVIRRLFKYFLQQIIRKREKPELELARFRLLRRNSRAQRDNFNLANVATTPNEQFELSSENEFSLLLS